MWTVFLVVWLAVCVAGLAASGYGLFELVTAYREPKKKTDVEKKEDGAEAVEVTEAAVVDPASEVTEVPMGGNTYEESLVIDMGDDDEEDEKHV